MFLNTKTPGRLGSPNLVRAYHRSLAAIELTEREVNVLA